MPGRGCRAIGLGRPETFHFLASDISGWPTGRVVLRQSRSARGRRLRRASSTYRNSLARPGSRNLPAAPRANRGSQPPCRNPFPSATVAAEMRRSAPGRPLPADRWRGFFEWLHASLLTASQIVLPKTLTILGVREQSQDVYSLAVV